MKEIRSCPCNTGVLYCHEGHPSKELKPSPFKCMAWEDERYKLSTNGGEAILYQEGYCRIIGPRTP